MGENYAALKNIATQLAAKLRVHGEKGREAWSQLHENLAEVAAMAGSDPRKAVEALLEVAKDASPSQGLEERVSMVKPDLLKDLVLLVADELSMTPLGDSEPVHMIDGHGDFCEANVDRIIKCSAELSARDPPYAVISIVGAQNSGKSYLLNRLFGTKFPVMDAKSGWEKTTRGIMISRCIAPSLLLLDVEGFDGIENAQDTLFENQAALFALTVSDLMIVNMNIVDICRAQGGGSQLFTTIFQERTKIEGGGLTKILVILRNSNGETPLEKLTSKILKRLQQLWESVNGDSIKLEGYIKVDIFEMTHKDLAAFPKQVAELRRLLSENRRAKFPASSFTKSSRILWDQIKENKNLNIPSHQVLLARSYCQQIVKEILSSLSLNKEYMRLKAQESPIHFKTISDEILERITIRYYIETKMYDPKVRVEELKNMIEELSKIFLEDSRVLIFRVHKNILEQYKGLFDKNIQNMKEVEAHAYGEQIVAECITKFISSLQDHKLFDSIYLKTVSGELEQKMQSYTAFRVLEIKEKETREKLENLKAALIAGGKLVVAGVSACVGMPPPFPL